MDVVIRAGRPVEADDLTELAMRSKAYWGYDQEFLDRCRPELTLRSDQIEVLRTAVAEVDGRLAGFVTVVGAPPEGDLDMLFVDTWAMGVGVGRLLFLHAVERARVAGFRSLRIEADPGAELFYVRMGAVREGQAVSSSTGRALPQLRYCLG